MSDASHLSLGSWGKRGTRPRDTAVATIAHRQHGVVARRQLVDLGLGPKAIEYRVAIGRLHPIHRGVYAVGHRGLTREGAWMAAVLAAVLPPHHLARAATEAEIRRLSSPTSLADLVARHPRRPGSPAIRSLLEARDIGRNITKRELELRFLAFLDAHDVPRPHVNATVDEKEVDCLWPEQRLIAELDGFATHGTREAFERDRARDRALQVAGYRVIRITWRRLVGDPPGLAEELRALLRR